MGRAETGCKSWACADWVLRGESSEGGADSEARQGQGVLGLIGKLWVEIGREGGEGSEDVAYSFLELFMKLL